MKYLFLCVSFVLVGCGSPLPPAPTDIKTVKMPVVNSVDFKTIDVYGEDYYTEFTTPQGLVCVRPFSTHTLTCVKNN